MIRRLTYAGLSLALASAAFADNGPQADAPSEEPARDESAAGLDAFVETAIRGGLLVSNDQAAVAGGQPVAAMDIETALVCAEDYPLDFSVVKSLRRLTELPGSGDGVEAAEIKAARLKDLKSKLALGLYSEAKALIASESEPDYRAYRKFSDLMSARTRADIAYFEELATCHPRADMWLAVAELSAFEARGAERIDAHVSSLRALPYNLREDVATIVVPSLILLRRQDVAQQLVATFSAEEIENSTQLMALKTAIIDMPNGSESDDRLVMLLSRPSLKLAALLVLIEREETLRPTIRDFVLEEAWALLERSEHEHGLDEILGFVIRHLERDNLYSGLERVRALPIAQADDIRASVDLNIMSALEDIIAQPDQEVSLTGLKTLTQFHTDLPLDERGNALRRRGAEMALELGLLSMVKTLLEPLERDPQTVLLLANAAYWGGANTDLFQLRASFPGFTELNHLAGIRAIQTGASEIATEAYAGLSEHPAKRLEIIEEGALAGNWHLFNANEGALSQELSLEDGLRLERVRRIYRANSQSGNRRPATVRPYQIPDLLDSTRLALSTPQAGANYDQ